MGTHNNNLLRLVILGCALGSSLSLPVQAAGNGVVVLQRDVQARQADRATGRPDPYPTTVNVNPSQRVLSQTNNELSDGDFASVASGQMVNRVLIPDASGTVRGLGNVPNSLPGMSGGAGPGAAAGSNSISNSVNQSVQRGLAPLQILTGGR
ncbi:hypothetical protein [Pseudomonas fontis]|uniref:Fap n=1 Tax=Pseudomonas fontis TaxID=2942633 RepID=A0ABT5NXW2_9PSED|nr:hypothetical protein [Pseudomonas fontis]MDD0972484.1 hypothetical protein [Pseudomonas fontis]MDD0993008.1 hypothetical protein [Pseudomonas fontis]